MDLTTYSVKEPKKLLEQLAKHPEEMDRTAIHAVILVADRLDKIYSAIVFAGLSITILLAAIAVTR